MRLSDMGWGDYFEQRFSELQAGDLIPGRVVLENRTGYELYTASGPMTGDVSGKFRYHAADRSQWPAVGDWVAVRPRDEEGRATIHAVLPRKSGFVRKAAGSKTVEQVIAANIDTVFVVCGLDGDFNVRRLERYLAAAWESGAMPVIVLNKADLCADIDAAIAEVDAVALGVPVHVVSALEGRGIDLLFPYLSEGRTVALLGSSGVGKSSIINGLLGERRLATAEVREDDSRGRHTTTHRELIQVPSGGMLLDTPGMRELQVWGGGESAADAFEDVLEIALHCRFRDCRHEEETGCAVRLALDDGTLDAGRFENFRKLGRELRRLEKRQAQRERQLEKALVYRKKERDRRLRMEAE